MVFTKYFGNKGVKAIFEKSGVEKMTRNYWGFLLMLIGLVIMFIAPNIADKWTLHLDYRDNEILYFDYVVRSMLLILIGFSSLISGLLLLIFRNKTASK